MDNIIKAKKVIQNNQEFLVGVFDINNIRNFTKYTERLIVGYIEIEGEDKTYGDKTQIQPDYNNQVQRKTNNAKVERIADFLITDPSAMFPTNIVIAIPQQVIVSLEANEDGFTTIILDEIVKTELQKENGNVFLTVIDGQHRIKGIERAIERLNYSIQYPSSTEEKTKYQSTLKRLLSLQLIVTFFIDPILEYQAMIFSTINKTQTKVPENLVYSLFGLSANDTPQKTSLEVVLALNGIEKSPFYNRIKLVGGNYKRGELIPLSQATMVKSILFKICKNQRESEIDRTKARDLVSDISNNLPFREYYRNNNDKMIVRILYSFFSAVKDVFINNTGISFWNMDDNIPTNVLQTNVGYQALMKLLTDLLGIMKEDERDKKEKYVFHLSKVKNINWEDNEGEKRYPFTSKSINVLYNDLKNEILVQ